MHERLPPAVQEIADELRWYGYKPVRMNMRDMVELAIRHGFTRIPDIADALDVTDKKVANCLHHTEGRGNLVSDGRGNWSLRLEDV